MAAGRLPKPGTEFGPCLDEKCGHIDCNSTRKQAKTECDICGKPIGYETRMYQNPDNPSGVVHADCLEEKYNL